MPKKSRRINSYTKPKTVKQDVPFPYKRVRIDWIDIITEGGWGTDKEFKDMKLATPVSEGWLFSKDSETVRIFVKVGHFLVHFLFLVHFNMYHQISVHARECIF